MSMKPTRLELILVYLLAVVAYGYFESHQDWNTYSRLALVKAVVEEGRFEIDSYQAGELETGDKAFYNGHYYSDKAIGASALGIIAYAPIRLMEKLFGFRIPIDLFVRLVTFLAISIPSALLAPIFYALIRPITGHAILALFITALACFGTPVFKYSTIYYGHVLVAVMFLCVLHIWNRLEHSGEFSAWIFIATGFGLGLMIATEFPTALLVLLAGIYILQILRMHKRILDWRPYVLMVLGFMLPIGMQLGYNEMIYGQLFASGYSHESTEIFRESHASGFLGFHAIDLMYLYYMTFHKTMGLFWQVPALLLAVPGWYFMLKNRAYQLLGVTTLQAVILYLLLFSGYYMWYGGLAFTPRHLIPVLPLMILPLAFLPKKLSVIMIGLGSISMLQMFAGAASKWNGIVELLEAMLSTQFSGSYPGSVLYDVILPNFFQGKLLNNLGHDIFGLTGLPSLLPLLIVAAGLIAVFILVVKKQQVGEI